MAHANVVVAVVVGIGIRRQTRYNRFDPRCKPGSNIRCYYYIAFFHQKQKLTA